MTKDEFKMLAAGMKAVYASQNFLPDREAMAIWYKLVEDIDYNAAAAAVQKHMCTNRFPPTPADIRQQCASFTAEAKSDWLQGWGYIGRVMSRYGYNRPKEAIAALRGYDPIAGDVAERLGWQNLCMSENQAADRANFRQAYESIQSRAKENAMLPPSLNLMIGGVSDKLQIGGGND